MKNITLNTTVTVNPTNYAIEQLEVAEHQTVAKMVTFSVDREERDVKVGIKSMDCKLRNVKNISSFIRLVCCAFYMQSANLNDKRLSILSDKDAENGLSDGERVEEEVRQLIKIELDIILSNFTNEEKMFCKVDSFVNCVSGALSGDFSVCYKNGASINSIVSKLATNTPDKEMKEAITKFTLAITGENDDVYNGYNLNCNGALLNDVKHRYYKGRSVNKDGKVVQKYDKDGTLVAKEIALAIIEDLQKKAE